MILQQYARPIKKEKPVDAVDKCNNCANYVYIHEDYDVFEDMVLDITTIKLKMILAVQHRQCPSEQIIEFKGVDSLNGI